jgi:phosphinothricin acetyltransferase
VLGWVQISTHRCATGGWARTKELSIFVHPDHLHKGIGTKLLDKMFHVLAHPEGYDERWISPSLRDEGRVRTIFAVIAVAASERDNKDRRMDFYRKMGFEPVGLLKNAGWKFDQW